MAHQRVQGVQVRMGYSASLHRLSPYNSTCSVSCHITPSFNILVYISKIEDIKIDVVVGVESRE